MKTPPTYWKVKASPIVDEFMHANRRFTRYWKYYGNATSVHDYEGWNDDSRHSDLPTLTQAQFKKHFYDPWKAGQNIDNATLYKDKTGDVHVIKKRTRTDSKRITLAKHNRITAELQRQCDYLQSLKQADQARIAQLEADRDQQQQQILNLTDQKSALVQQVNRKEALLNEKQKYIHAVEQKFINCANDLEKTSTRLKEAEYHISKLHVTHLREINELSKQRDGMAAVVMVVGIIAFGLAIAQLIGGAA